MTYNARGALSIYTKVLAWGGSALLVALLWSDRRWMEQPWITLFMLGAVIALRRGQIPLSKFSYLTQVGVVVLVGAVTVGPGPGMSAVRRAKTCLRARSTVAPTV